MSKPSERSILGIQSSLFFARSIHGLLNLGSSTGKSQYSIFILGLILFMNASNYGPINLGNPEELSVLEIANMIRHKSNQKLDLKFLNQLEDDPLRRRPSIDIAQQELNWKPKISFKDGLEITREYFQKMLIK